MPRLVRAAKLDSAKARETLSACTPESGPYWRRLEPGLALGYYKPPGGAPGSWWARRRVDGRYRKERFALADDGSPANGVDVLDYSQAQRLLLSEDRAAAESGMPRAFTVGDALDYWWTDYESRTRSPVAVSEQAHKVRAVRDALGATRVAELTGDAIKAWLAGIVRKGRTVRAVGSNRKELAAPEKVDAREVKRRRQATANRRLSVLKAALNQAWKAGKVRCEPVWQRVDPYKNADQARARYLSHGEATRLLNAATPAFRPLVHAAILTGCRWGELREMRCQQFDRESATVAVLHTKAGRDRRVPLTSEGVAFFEQVTAGRDAASLVFPRKNGEAWAPQDQKRPMARACKGAGIAPAVGFHALRHTYGSLLAQEGVSLKVIAAAMGHSDTRMTERHYAHLSHDYVAEQIRDNLPTFAPVPGSNVANLDRARLERAKGRAQSKAKSRAKAAKRRAEQ
jgi:integrase